MKSLLGRLVRVAATLSRYGFAAGDQLVLLLPNQAEYLKLVYASAFRNGLFRMGDVGYQDAEVYLYILDRASWS